MCCKQILYPQVVLITSIAIKNEVRWLDLFYIQTQRKGNSAYDIFEAGLLEVAGERTAPDSRVVRFEFYFEMAL